MKTLKKGFTLIELLVVIAIIGILSSVVLASLNTARVKGRKAAVQSGLKEFITQATLMATDNGIFLATSAVCDTSDATMDKIVININKNADVDASCTFDSATVPTKVSISASTVSGDPVCISTTGKTGTTAATGDCS